MPRRAVSHSERQSKKTKAQAGKAYDQNVRKHGALKAAKDVRSSARWQKLRLMKLSYDPVCEDPMGDHPDKPIAARQVDHIIPLQEDIGKAFDMDNLQSLCVHCHALKSARERADGAV